MDNSEKMPKANDEGSKKNLFDFFQSSPLVGADVDLDRLDDSVTDEERARENDRVRVVKKLEEGINIEAAVYGAGQRIREQSKTAYDTARLDARLLFMTCAARFLAVRNGVPGKTSPEIEERLALITVLYQGTSPIENLISEGQYIKTAAAIKQDYEAIARLEELIASPETRKSGVVPPIRYVTADARRYYGELNDVAHITRHDLLKQLLRSNVEGDARGFSPIPVFHRETAISLYDLHLWLLSQATMHHVQLLRDMYGDGILSELGDELRMWLGAIERLEAEAGWTDVTHHDEMRTAKDTSETPTAENR